MSCDDVYMRKNVFIWDFDARGRWLARGCLDGGDVDLEDLEAEAVSLYSSAPRSSEDDAEVANGAHAKPG